MRSDPSLNFKPFIQLADRYGTTEQLPAGPYQSSYGHQFSLSPVRESNCVVESE